MYRSWIYKTLLKLILKVKAKNKTCHIVSILYLHGADAQAPVDDKLAEGRRPLVTVPTVDHEETTQMFELSHWEVGSQGRLLSLLYGTHFREKSQRLWLCRLWLNRDWVQGTTLDWLKLRWKLRTPTPVLKDNDNNMKIHCLFMGQLKWLQTDLLTCQWKDTWHWQNKMYLLYSSFLKWM